MDTKEWTRREWLTRCGGGALLVWATGCTSVGATVRRHEPGRKVAPLPILKVGPTEPAASDSVLRRRATEARDLGKAALAKLDAEMRATLTLSGGVGLAAPQVGVPRRVILVQLQTTDKPVLTCVDPVIVATSPTRIDGYEACLSIPAYGALVSRACWVEVAYLDLSGRPHRRVSKGWEARIFQHEIDHLDGILHVDKLAGELVSIDEMRKRRKQRRERDEREGRPNPCADSM